MKAIDWIAVKLEEEAEEIVNAVVEQAKADDWRAGAWLFDRVYGKPQEHVELETKEKDWYDMTPAELDAALAKFLREHGKRLKGPAKHDSTRPGRRFPCLLTADITARDLATRAAKAERRQRRRSPAPLNEGVLAVATDAC